MAQNYTRQSSFNDGDTITASLFNDEYNQLVNSFTYSSTSASSTGHRHDGSAGQGGNIFKIGDLDFLNKIEVDSTNNRWGFYVEVSSAAVEQIRIQDGAVVPVTDNDIDLGTTSLEFKDLFIDGTAHIDTLDVDENATVAGTLGVTGTTTLTGNVTTTNDLSVGGNLTVTGTTTFNGGTITMGDAATDNVVFGADVDSNIIPDDDDTYDLGSSSQEWRNLYIDGTANIDSLVADTADINGGTIDGTVIGGTTPASITGTAITGTSFVIGSANISESELETIDGITAGTVAASKAVVVDANKDATGFRNITITGELDAATLDVSGNIDVDGVTNLDVVDIDGAVDMASTLTVASNITVGGTVDGRDVAADGTKLDTVETNADVTDTANVTAAGALMDSELTNITAVKALDQGVATTDSPTFAGLTTTADVSFGDNDKAVFGAGSDLQIYHDGSHSYISDQGTGHLKLLVRDFRINNDSDTKQIMKTVVDGQVELYHNNSKKFETTSTGIDVTGVITTDGMTTSADINFGDNDKAVFGAGSDLQIYHDGSRSYISDQGTGGVRILTNEFSIKSPDESESLFLSVQDGSAYLYNDNTIRLETTSTGIDVTGTVTADAVATGTSTFTGNLTIDAAGASVTVKDSNDGGTVAFVFENDSGTTSSIRGASSSQDIQIKPNEVLAANFATGGDISFYEDTGTTAKFFWDASAERLGVGSTSPAATLDVVKTGAGIQDTLQLRNAQTLAAGVGSSLGFGDSGGARLAYIAGAATGSNNDNGYLSFYTRASDSLAERMRIDSSGLVAIGTSSPVSTAQLTVGGTSRIAPVSGNGLLLASGGSDRMFISTAGNVGIGTSSPNSIVDIRENATGGQARLRLFNTDQTNSTAQSALLFMSPDLRANGVEIEAVKENADFSAAAGRDIAITFSPVLNNAATERMRIDSSGNVGIGTSSPTFATGTGLQVTSGSFASVRVNHSGSTGLDVSQAGGGAGYLYLRDNADLIFGTNNTERMRIDASGNLLVGTTDSSIETSSSGEGVNIFPNKISVARNGVTANFNRLSDGDIVKFRKDGTAVGSIGVVGGSIIFGRGDTALAINDSLDAIYPLQADGTPRDGAIDLGRSGTSGRFKDLYLSGNVTSSGTFRGGSGSASTPTFLTDGATGMFRASSNDIGFSCAGSEAMRIDSSGNLLVSGTSSSIDAGSISLEAQGRIRAGRSGGAVMQLNRTTSDGDIAVFYKDSVSVGSIGTFGSDLYIGTNDSGLRFEYAGLNAIVPFDVNSSAVSDAATDLGNANARFKDLYLSSIAKVGSGSFDGGGVQHNYGSDANSRSWWAKTDTHGYGDFALRQSTTKTGSTYETKLLIDASGHVGIGTTSASSRLTVRSPDNTLATNIAQFNSQNGGAGFKFGYQRIEQIGATVPITFETGGSESMRIDSSGNVGVGTTSPSSFNYLSTSPHLVIGGGSSDAGVTCYSSTNGYGRLAFADGTNTTEQYRGLIQFYHGDNSMQFYTGSDERMRIDSSGRVGIGTTSPDAPIEISRSNAGIIQYITNTGSGQAYTAYGNSDNPAWSQDFNTAGGLLIGIDADETGVLYQGGNKALRFGTNAAERMRIDSAGNVGIGESNPSEKLAIAKGISYNADSALFSTIGINDGAVNNNATYRWRTGITGNATGHSYTFSTLARTQGSYVERMRIDSSGNLLAGTTSQINNCKTNILGTNITNVLGLKTEHANDLINGFSSTTETFRVSSTGNVTNLNNAYGSLSDERLKSNIVDAPSQLDDIMAVQVRSYTLNSTGETHIGVVAQELEASGMSGLVEEDKEGIKSVKYSVLYMKAIKALQEQNELINDLRARVAQLEGAN